MITLRMQHGMTRALRTAHVPIQKAKYFMSFGSRRVDDICALVRDQHACEN